MTITPYTGGFTQTNGYLVETLAGNFLIDAPEGIRGWMEQNGKRVTDVLLTRYNLSGFLTKGSTEASTKAEEPDSMMMEMEKTPGMAPAPRNMGKNWRGPDYKKIAPAASRGNVEDLVDTLIFRFFQGPVPKLARESFIDYAKAKKGVIFTDKEVGELCHLMMSTPYYQLC